MATNLLDSVKAYVTPGLLSLAASRLGESETSVSKGLSAALPLIMGALIQKSDDTSLWSQIMSLFTSRASRPDVLADPRAMFSGDTSGAAMADLGDDLLATLFGKQLGTVTSALGDHAGLKSTSASSILTLAATLITGTLGQKVRAGGLSPTALMSLLNGQRDGISKALPGALAGLGGLGTLRSYGDTTTVVRDVERRTSSGLGWVPWVGVAALALLVGAWALTRGTRMPEVQTPNVVSSDADAARRAGQMAREAGDAPARQPGQAASNAVEQDQIAATNLGAYLTRRLPSSVELSVPERGVESQLLAYLDDPGRQGDPAIWFNFDRLLFETGSASLKAESREQLENVAEIMKAYPATKMKIGGYTDNVGDPASNLKLSQDRANNVMAAIVANGIAPDRLSSEGYGEQHPVADNSTDSGRQQNRRIALNVTEK